jgi:hypothetical protein
MLRRIRRFLTEETAIYLEKRGKKSILQQIKELKALKKYYGYVPYQYVKHCLYLKSFDGDIFDYMPPEIVHRYRDKINPEQYRDNVIDKKKFSEIMIQNNLPSVAHLFTAHRNGSIRGWNGKEVSFHEFKNHLAESGNCNFFIKPVNAGSGNGIYKMVLRDACLEINKKKTMGEKSFREILFLRSPYDEFMVQPEIIQHEELNRLNPSCVNSVRIDTLIQGNEVVSNAALLRMSNGYRYTDNWAKGGIIVNIDLETGALGVFGKTKAKYGRLEIRRHPVTGICFEGMQIPFWSKVRELVRSAALVLRPLMFLGWDVAISVDGPILIEANHDFSVFMPQEASGGLRRTAAGKAILRALRHIDH